MQILEERIRSLSPELQRQVMDFIDFLLIKYSSTLPSKEISKRKSVGGALSQYKNPLLLSKEETAWEDSIAEKYENR